MSVAPEKFIHFHRRSSGWKPVAVPGKYGCDLHFLTSWMKKFLRLDLVFLKGVLTKGKNKGLEIRIVRKSTIFASSDFI